MAGDCQICRGPIKWRQMFCALYYNNSCHMSAVFRDDLVLYVTEMRMRLQSLYFLLNMQIEVNQQSPWFLPLECSCPFSKHFISTGVSAIGLKSFISLGLVIFGTGVIIAYFHRHSINGMERVSKDRWNRRWNKNVSCWLHNLRIYHLPHRVLLLCYI